MFQLFTFSVELEAFGDELGREVHSAFDERHCLDEARPIVFGEPFVSSEACELADDSDDDPRACRA